MRIAARRHGHRLTVDKLPIAAVRRGPGEELVQRHPGWGAFAQRDHAARIAPLPSGVARLTRDQEFVLDDRIEIVEPDLLAPPIAQAAGWTDELVSWCLSAYIRRVVPIVPKAVVL